MYRIHTDAACWIIYDLLEVSFRGEGEADGAGSSYRTRCCKRCDDDFENPIPFADIYLDLRNGKARINFCDCEDLFDDRFLNGNKRLDLCMSFVYQGASRSIVMSKAVDGFHRLEREDVVYSCKWKFDANQTSVRMLREAIASQPPPKKSGWSITYKSVMFNTTITGYYLDTEACYPLQRWPAIPDPERCLFSLAKLLASSDKNFVVLVPRMYADEERTLRMHRRTLCNNSSYFKILLESDFAEAQNFGSGHQQDNAPSSTAHRPQEMSSTCMHESANFMMIADSSPRIELHDMTYLQLKTLVFFIYTGVAALERRCDSIPAASVSDQATKTESSSAPQPNQMQAAFTESKPWWKGHLPPADPFYMYRLADKYDIKGLCKAALRHIASDISRLDLLADYEQYEEIRLFPKIAKVYKEYCERNKERIRTECANHEEIFRVFDVEDVARKATDTSA